MLTVIAWLIGVPLCLFALRRYALLLASLLPRRHDQQRTDLSVVILIAARNEAALLPAVLAGLDCLNYPPDLLDVVIVSDGSTDATEMLATAWARRHGRAQVVALGTAHGKAAALDIALGRGPPSDVVAVLDADTVPEPDALAILLGAFADDRVGAACGYPDPGVGQPTVAARYAAVERWVFHLVTQAGKDRLGLRPSIIGAFFAVRRQALIAAGGFAARSVSEDIELSQRITAHGWITRWIGAARVTERVPENLAAFARQRGRWTRGLLATARSARSIEDLFVAAAYLDRPLVVGAMLATAAGAMSAWVVLFYAGSVAATITIALWRAGALWERRCWTAVVTMAFADILLTLRSLSQHLRGTQLLWGDRATRPATTRRALSSIRRGHGKVVLGARGVPRASELGNANGDEGQ